jgi:hypothetical protein
MAAVGGGRITTVVTVPTRTTRGATGTVAIGTDSRGKADSGDAALVRTLIGGTSRRDAPLVQDEDETNFVLAQTSVGY